MVQVREIPSKRWDLAIEQLEVGGEMTVLEGDPAIGLHRDVGWPGADGRVHVLIFTERDPKSVTQEIASSEVSAGLESLAVALIADPRLAGLLARHGVVRKYVFDYGYGGAQNRGCGRGRDRQAPLTRHAHIGCDRAKRGMSGPSVRRWSNA